MKIVKLQQSRDVGRGEGCEECSRASRETVEAEGTYHFLIIAVRERVRTEVVRSSY